MHLDKRRPENTLPAHLYYNQPQAKKYSQCSRMIKIQREMSSRCLDLLGIPPDSPPLLLLDIGCGSGISGSVISDRNHYWIGTDISRPMVDVANSKKQLHCGDMLLNDMGHGLPFNTAVFDGAVSVSALQWLCTSYNRSENPLARIRSFFTSLYRCLRRGAKVAMQFYPEGPKQTNLLMKGATLSGFHGGVVVDFPNSTKARKLYLVLFAGVSDNPGSFPGGSDALMDVDSAALPMGPHAGLPPGLTEATAPQTIQVFEDRGRSRRDRQDRRRDRRNGRSGRRGRRGMSLKEWVVRKKVRDRLRGRKVAADSKYTGRRRKDRF